MIRAEFLHTDGNLVGFVFSGHALFDEHGKDIVCAAVTSAVELCANGITELAGADPTVEVKDNTISLKLRDGTNEKAVFLLGALKLHMEVLIQDYEEFITVIHSEV